MSRWFREGDKIEIGRADLDLGSAVKVDLTVVPAAVRAPLLSLTRKEEGKGLETLMITQIRIQKSTCCSANIVILLKFS